MPGDALGGFDGKIAGVVVPCSFVDEFAELSTLDLTDDSFPLSLTVRAGLSLVCADEGLSFVEETSVVKGPRLAGVFDVSPAGFEVIGNPGMEVGPDDSTIPELLGCPISLFDIEETASLDDPGPGMAGVLDCPRTPLFDVD